VMMMMNQLVHRYAFITRVMAIVVLAAVSVMRAEAQRCGTGGGHFLLQTGESSTSHHVTKNLRHRVMDAAFRSEFQLQCVGLPTCHKTRNCPGRNGEKGWGMCYNWNFLSALGDQSAECITWCYQDSEFTGIPMVAPSDDFYCRSLAQGSADVVDSLDDYDQLQLDANLVWAVNEDRERIVELIQKQRMIIKEYHLNSKDFSSLNSNVEFRHNHKELQQLKQKLHISGNQAFDTFEAADAAAKAPGDQCNSTTQLNCWEPASPHRRKSHKFKCVHGWCFRIHRVFGGW